VRPRGWKIVIIVYTCILGGFDSLRPPLVPPEPGVRWICFTDVPVLPDVPPWEFRPVHQTGNPSRTSRLPKILPHLVLPVDCDYSIWLDGNLQLAKPATEIVNAEMRFDDWAAHRHPARGCVYEEAALLQRLKRDVPNDWPNLDAGMLDEEIERYRAMGFPRGLGTLTANGLIVRKHTEAVNALNERWWKLFVDGCGRDQLSFPVALWSMEGTPTLNRMPHYHDIYNSPLVRFGWHAAWKDKPDNVRYRPERERIAARVARLREVAGDGGYGWLKP
jgi:Protein of unknown function (DUF616)